MRFGIKRLRHCLAVGLSMLIVAVGSADTWDEAIDGRGDAGDFPVGQFQTTTGGFFTVITGSMSDIADPDRDSFLITVTDPTTFSAVCEDAGINREADTRLWLWTRSGELLMANDDNPETPAPDLPLLSALTDPSTWVGPVVDNPQPVEAGQTYILTIGGFASDPDDIDGVDLADLSNAAGVGFDALAGKNPNSDGTFNRWENFITNGGDYVIRLTGAQFGQVLETCDFQLGDANRDGDVNLLDVGPFVDAVTAGDFLCEADVNQDGLSDLRDVAPFVALLTGG